MELADAMGILQSRVMVTNSSCGSVVVDFTVTSTVGTTDAKTASTAITDFIAKVKSDDSSLKAGTWGKYSDKNQVIVPLYYCSGSTTPSTTACPGTGNTANAITSSVTLIASLIAATLIAFFTL
jgi:hypothetical protein